MHELPQTMTDDTPSSCDSDRPYSGVKKKIRLIILYVCLVTLLTFKIQKPMTAYTEI